MNTDGHGLKHAAITQRVLGVFFQVYNELGYGFLESVYVEALAVALQQSGLTLHREMPLEVRFRSTVIGRFRADIVVAGTVLVEVKARRRLLLMHQAQVLNYLRATVLEVGLLLNFGPRPQFKRLLFDNDRKVHRTTCEPAVNNLCDSL
jgi:GxxExxY protein